MRKELWGGQSGTFSDVMNYVSAANQPAVLFVEYKWVT
jgi:hypothetical protein